MYLIEWALRYDVTWRRDVQISFSCYQTGWRWVVNFKLRPLYPQGNSPQKSLENRLVGHKPGAKKITFWNTSGLERRPLFSPSCSQSLYSMPYPGSSQHNIIFELITIDENISRNMINIFIKNYSLLQHRSSPCVTFINTLLNLLTSFNYLNENTEPLENKFKM
jgi:hypothetical protein